MSTMQFLTPLGLLCSVSIMAGCGGTGRRVSESFFDKKDVSGVAGTSRCDTAIELRDSPRANLLPLPARNERGEGEVSALSTLSFLNSTAVSRCDVRAPTECRGASLSNAIVTWTFVPPATARAERAVPGVADEDAFRKLDLNGDGALTLDEWQHFDASARARDDFSALDENGDGQVNWTEFLKQATKHRKRYQFFGSTEKINGGYVAWDKELFQQPGWQLFSIQF